jgi:hypothetical protein
MMRVVVLLFGLALTGFGVAGLVRPRKLMQSVATTWQTSRGLYLAMGLRILLGVALLATGPGSRFPQVLWALGILSLAAALGLPVLGLSRFQRFVQWWAARPEGVIRAWSVFAAAFGGFLLYAVW